ncbi:Eukaryotic translation initiation factor 3 subunit D-2 [Labeo rohita]|uniref:Eukaryotic translation initiation factor 3 subunit D-2 n=1 Tax=Labeo rohita TaxID=84645 RepID=A0ABQ8MXY4_LABRO|nr:Eukaryotic translation initiation factor 3 subunit D-2 [Labeo rohita]
MFLHIVDFNGSHGLKLSRRQSLTPFTRRVSHKIAKGAGCSQSAVSKHGNRKLSGRKKCGRKRCTTNRENRSLERLVRPSRFKNLVELHKEWTEAGVKASRATTHRRVKEFGYSCRIPLVGQRSKVLFSDESKFSFGNQGPRV